MPRRGRSHPQELERQQFAAEEATCTNESQITDDTHEAQRALKALADYFALLREWELNSRPDNGLAPDSTTDQS